MGSHQQIVVTFCFQVRATNLQDLVYKNGQAGISKATVSITFDNADKEQSPIGMEAHDEITVRRVFTGCVEHFFVSIFLSSADVPCEHFKCCNMAMYLT